MLLMDSTANDRNDSRACEHEHEWYGRALDSLIKVHSPPDTPDRSVAIYASATIKNPPERAAKDGFSTAGREARD